MDPVHAKDVILRLLMLLRRTRQQRRARPRMALPVLTPSVGPPAASNLQLPAPSDCTPPIDSELGLPDSPQRTVVELGPLRMSEEGSSLTEAAVRDVHDILARYRRSESLDQMMARYRDSLLRRGLSLEAIEPWVSQIRAFVADAIGIPEIDGAVPVIDVRRRRRIAQAAARLRRRLRASRPISKELTRPQKKEPHS
jgi:hypothetical protein